MKKSISSLLIIVTLLVLSFTSVVGFPKNSWTISQSQVGAIRLGMTISELYLLYPNRSTFKLVDENIEGEFTPSLALFADASDKKPTMLLRLDCNESQWLIQSILVYDPQYKTENGIGVGSTLKELRQQYPIDIIGWDEGVLHAGSRTKAKGMTFFLDPSKLPLSTLKKWINNVPDETKVQAIYIY